MQGGETPPSFIAMKRVSAQIKGDILVVWFWRILLDWDRLLAVRENKIPGPFRGGQGTGEDCKTGREKACRHL